MTENGKLKESERREVEIKVQEGKLYWRYKVATEKERKTYYKEILWTMVNMAMIDNDFSENEKKLIECCCKDWKVEDSLLEEMIEIAKTLYSLYSHLDLLKSINRPYGEIEPLVNELNVNKAVLEENLKELLSA